ncbi:restriction endonuclease subunit S [Rhizobium sp. BK008]|uniref:restriction endonuclease subunit S n=1 Tax=Rhizobium sp. BK008 TaxID=2587094 RepID=UPI00161940A8|nr:restriction endonuclease subunit S [Rhizobium sp. BK008]MBB4253034.1 type I restriction enzyme S subunit [Rhizobium sp. BK008]
MKRRFRVKELLDKGVLWVEDGNHGENRPLQNEFSSVGTPFIRPPDLIGGFVNFVDCDRINEKARSRVRKGMGRAGDILFTHRATVGRIALAPKNAPEFVANPGVTVWRSLNHDVLDTRYLYYWMQTSHFMDQVWSVAGSTDTFPYISLTQQRELQLEVPLIEDQRSIGRILGSLDENIELNRRMNETLEAMAQAIFRDWFVDFGPTRRKLEGATDPVEIMGGLVQDAERAQAIADLSPAVFGDNGLPEGWKSKSLLDQANWINGAAYKNMHFSDAPDALPVVKIAELKNGVTSNTKRTNTALGERYRISDGELLFSWSGNPDTSIDAFVWIGGDAWLNQHIFAVRENGVRSKAALYVLLKALMPQFAELARNKQTTGLGHVTKEDMRRLEIAVAPKPVEAAFEALVTPIIDLLVSKLVENRTLAATRDLLLPKLMSGEIRLAEGDELMEASQ